MKLNVNKDLLLKHKFWIFLVVALPMVLAAMFVLLVPIADTIAKERKDVDKLLLDLKKPSGVFIPQQKIDELNQEVAKAVAKEYGVWGKAYAEQAAGNSLFWPESFDKTYDFEKHKFL